ncbi:hypothetical protein Scep_002123 [Stephania cephalantha]|uniref:Uncharacterized protein n=1 Tax=Stephania cephalantha TaxID=152367 RepID=A0AAP0L9D5_9MAGN
MNASLDNLINDEDFLEPIHCNQEEEASSITLRSVKEYEYFIKLVDELEFLPSEPNVIIAEVHEEEYKMKTEVTLEKPYEPYEENKEDQHMVLMNLPHVFFIFAEFETRMEQKGHLEILCDFDSYMLDCQDYMETYLLEVQDEFKTLKEDMPISLSRLP